MPSCCLVSSKKELSEAGLHFHWWPLETVEIAKTADRQISIGSVGGGRSSSLMLSGDQNIVDVTFSVIWSVNDPGKFLFNVRDPESMVRQVSESAMREVGWQKAGTRYFPGRSYRHR